jgi:asparagine synthetase B (glutamine-hydrolysing)
MVVDGAPGMSPNIVAARRIGEIAKAHGIDVVVSGDGGDQALDGSPRLFGDLARRGHVLPAIESALRVRGAIYHNRIGRLVQFLLIPLAEPFVPQGLVGCLQTRRRTPPWAGRALARRLRSAASPREGSPRIDEAPDERYARVLRRIGDSWALGRQQDEIVGGYTLRAPLLDDDFIRFAATLPPLSLLRGDFLRGLMRESMAGLVPDDVRFRETKGSWFWFVHRAIEEAGGLGVLSRLADVRMLSDLGLVEPKPFRRFFDAYAGPPADGANYDDVWRVLSTEAFLRQHAGEPIARAA